MPSFAYALVAVLLVGGLAWALWRRQPSTRDEKSEAEDGSHKSDRRVDAGNTASEDEPEAVTGLTESSDAPLLIRFGHAFPHPLDAAADPIAEAAAVLDGSRPLGPRDPHESSVVWEAERHLGIARNKRPVYVYVGCLHPKLGSIGFIVSRAWFGREPHGVTRCDSGGLVSGRWGFRHLEPAEAVAALLGLSHAPDIPWEEHLLFEVGDAFGEFRKYLSGEVPKPNCYRDARQKCIDGENAAKMTLDRRLWTWEARGFAPIAEADVEAIVLAAEASKKLLDRFGGKLPGSMPLVIGHASAAGMHHFEEDDVVAAFEGRLP
jgi:hypothetical protein